MTGRMKMTPAPSRARPELGRSILTLMFVVPAWAGSETASPGQDIVEIRGQRMSVWPVEDLQERGFDVRDLPRDDNAAWVYIEAINAYLDLPEELQPAFEYAHSKAWPQSVPALGEWLDRRENRSALELARKASETHECQMPAFGDPSGSVISVVLPSLSHCRTLAKMIVADGRRLEAEKKYDAALEQYRAAMRMGHHVNQGMTLIDALVGISCWSLGNSAARDLVLRHRVPEAPLAEIAQHLHELRPLVPTLNRGFESERQFGTGIVEEIVSNPTALVGNLRSLGQSGDPSRLAKPQSGWDRLESRLGHLFLPDRTMKRHMLRYYDELIEMAKLPAHDPRVRDYDESKIIEEVPKWDFLTRIMLPSLSRARQLAVRCHAETAATELCVALRLYALRHEGKPPASLAELSEVRDAELIDPFSGREFQYERNSDGWSLYSVGTDGEDNGGKSGERWDEAGSDMVYVFPPKAIEPYVPEDDENH